MNITALYDVGVTVYTVVTRKVSQHVACVPCGSTGAVVLEGSGYVCPACNGRVVETGGNEQVVEPVVITRVLARKTAQETVIRYEGIRSGTKNVSLLEDALYATEAEAEATLT